MFPIIHFILSLQSNRLLMPLKLCKVAPKKPFNAAFLKVTDTTSLEAEIDWMVYDLYGLTEEERKIVEGE
ncbi:MAG: hypothetical protein IPL63_06090 [Saprospiraceae bacterium]|nr:hypothetical protein [Saprospiraceae bacterium]